MDDSEDTVQQRLQSIRDDWQVVVAIKRGLGARLAGVKRDGASWRRIASETAIPMTDARRWAEPHLSDDETAGAA